MIDRPGQGRGALTNLLDGLAPSRDLPGLLSGELAGFHVLQERKQEGWRGGQRREKSKCAESASERMRQTYRERPEMVNGVKMAGLGEPGSFGGLETGRKRSRVSGSRLVLLVPPGEPLNTAHQRAQIDRSELTMNLFLASIPFLHAPSHSSIVPGINSYDLSSNTPPPCSLLLSSA